MCAALRPVAATPRKIGPCVSNDAEEETGCDFNPRTDYYNVSARGAPVRVPGATLDRLRPAEHADQGRVGKCERGRMHHGPTGCNPDADKAATLASSRRVENVRHRVLG